MTELHHYNNVETKQGPHEDVYNTENIRGSCTGLRGNAQNLTGDVTWLNGDVTGLSGDATGCSTPGSDLYIGDVTAMQPNTPIAKVL